jgi:hypothetical protein
MTTWLKIPKDRINELDEINARFNNKLCSYIETIDGLFLTNADKLQDLYWSAYHAFLSSLTPFEGTPVWPTPPVEVEETNS